MIQGILALVSWLRVWKRAVGIKKIAERSDYAFRGRYHDPELNDFYYEDVYYKNCMVAADGSPIKYGKGWQCLLFHYLY